MNDMYSANEVLIASLISFTAGYLVCGLVCLWFTMNALNKEFGWDLSIWGLIKYWMGVK